MVHIKLNLTLIKITGKKEINLEIESSRKLNDVLNEIGLSHDDIGMVLRNGRWAPLDCIVEENDVFQLFPHLEGG